MTRIAFKYFAALTVLALPMCAGLIPGNGAVNNGIVSSPMADLFPGSLWIGNDGSSSFGILNTSKTGTTLRTIPNTAAIGFAIIGNDLYANSGTGGNKYNLDTLVVDGTFTLPHTSEDMTEAGGFIYSGDFNGHAIDKVDPTTGLRVGGFSVGFVPLGLASDGSGGFWVSEFASGALIRHFDGSGNLLGTLNPTDIAGFRGGLAFDSSDGTLYIGAQGAVYHYTTAGVDLGHFSTEANRFVDGLELTPTAVPEPASEILVGTLILALAGLTRRVKANR